MLCVWAVGERWSKLVEYYLELEKLEGLVRNRMYNAYISVQNSFRPENWDSIAATAATDCIKSNATFYFVWTKERMSPGFVGNLNLNCFW